LLFLLFLLSTLQPEREWKLSIYMQVLFLLIMNIICFRCEYLFSVYYMRL
jgi:hypothetical protein